MKRAAVTLLLALPLFFNNVTVAALENITIKPDCCAVTASLLNYRETDVFEKQINLAPASDITITITDVSSDFWFIVVQIHTFQYNATLAYDKTSLNKVSNRSVFGSNIGLYLKTYNVEAPIQVFLKHDNVHNLDALLVIVPYGRNAPIPGGCNMEFEIEIAPYQKLHAENGMIIVDAQPASLPAADGLSFSCEKNPVQHRMYRFYLPRQDFTMQTYFNAIASMLTAQNISRNAVEIPPSFMSSSMRRVYSVYPGTGFVYAVVATYGNYSTAYVPTFTYGCSPILYPESCQILNDTFSKVICAIILFIGFLSITIGHKRHYAYADHSLSICAMGGFVGYTLVVGTSSSETTISVLTGLAFGLFAGSISICMQIRKCSNSLYILLSNFSLGFLCACITYLYTSAKIFYILESDWLFWPMFMSVVLAVTAILMMMCNISKIIVRAVFGSYFVIIALDYYANTNLKYIIISIIRRITIPGFNLAFVYPPLQGADIGLIFFWIALIIMQLIKISCASLTQPSTHFSSETQALLGTRQRRIDGRLIKIFTWRIRL